MTRVSYLALNNLTGVVFTQKALKSQLLASLEQAYWLLMIASM